MIRHMSEADDPLRAHLEDRVRFEALLADLSSEFVNLEPGLVDGAIEGALKRLVEALDVDRGALTEISDAEDTLVFTHYWCRTGTVPILGVPAEERYPFGMSRIRKGEVHCFSSVAELPPDAADREALERTGTKSAAIVPLIVAGRVIGSLGFTCMRERSWDPAIVNRLRLVADVLASALARKRADLELRSAVESRIAFESLIADLSSQFVSLDSNLIDGMIEDAQRRIVEALDIDRSVLLQLSPGDGPLAFTHYWSRPELPPADLSSTVVSRFPWALAKVMRGELVCVSEVADLPAEAAIDRASFEAFGTKSNVTIPLTASGRTIGALSFAALRHVRRWTPEVINRLRLIAEVFASALARKRAEAELRRTLEENVQLRERLSQENIYLRQEVHARGGSRTLVTGPSAAVQHVLEQVTQVASTGATVLLLGETGTGKELIATAIHEQSSRRMRTMVRVNCAAIPVALIESELFGREKGAYTGAIARQAGRFELANGSTIFLDEIGELTADVQVKLLRVLQEKQIERLGGSRPIDLDLRVIAATNRDLDRAVADGIFREDLYYRLNVFPIRVPPLRERTEDIPALVWAFVDEFSKAMGKRVESISKEHMAGLQRYPWPGNIRELRNVVEHAVIVSKGPRLTIEPPGARAGRRHASTQLADVEREHILSVLQRTGWRIRGHAGAAELLNLKPSTLEGRMEKLGLRRPKP